MYQPPRLAFTVSAESSDSTSRPFLRLPLICARSVLRRMPCARMKASRSEEHTSELQSLMRISYAVFCLKKKKQIKNYHNNKDTIHHYHTLALMKTSTVTQAGSIQNYTDSLHREIVGVY